MSEYVHSGMVLTTTLRQRAMSDQIRRIIQEQEALDRLLNPLTGIEQHVFDQGQLYAKFSARGAVIEALRKEEEWRDGVLGVLGKGLAEQSLKDLQRYKSIAEQPWNKASVFDTSQQQSEIARLATEAALAKVAYERSFRLPSSVELGNLTISALSASNLARDILGKNDTLASTLAGFQSPWAHIGEEGVSAKAISEIISMGRGIAIKGAFDEDFVKSLRVGLGDWRDVAFPPLDSLMHVAERLEFYGAVGYSSELSNFPPQAFDEGLRSAQLVEEEDVESEADRDEDDDAARARNAFDRLRRFEVAVRQFIDQSMRKEFGEHWARQQVPEAIYEDWRRKQTTAVQQGGQELSLIEYADFADYKTIIERKDNWAKVFKAVFGRAEDIRESFQRLFPVRIATMHARPITQDDVLLLVVETKRVLKAIGAD